MRWLVLAACGAPAALPVTNVTPVPTLRVRPFAGARADARASECTAVEGPTWPEAEDAVLREIRAEHPGLTIAHVRVRQEHPLVYPARDVHGDVIVAVRVTRQRGFVSIDDHSGETRIYCIRVVRDGPATDLVPAELQQILFEDP